jgi:ribonuclease PH
MLQFLRIVSLTVALGASPLPATEVTANKNDVTVVATPSREGKVLKTLKQGDRVTSIDRQGMYWRVKLDDGKEGYVSVLNVRPKPSSQGSNLSKVIQKSVKDGRAEDDVANNRARSAVMGVRGFDEDEKIALMGNVRPNLRMVYRMEDRSVADRNVDKLANQVFSEVEKRSMRAEK